MVKTERPTRKTTDQFGHKYKDSLCIRSYSNSRRWEPGTLPQKRATHKVSPGLAHKRRVRDPCTRTTLRIMDSNNDQGIFWVQTAQWLTAVRPRFWNKQNISAIQAQSKRESTTILSLSERLQDNSLTHRTSSSYRNQKILNFAMLLNHTQPTMVGAKFLSLRRGSLAPRSRKAKATEGLTQYWPKSNQTHLKEAVQPQNFK